MKASYWFSRLIFERALALIYVTAFAVAINQFVPLLGERGLLPVKRFTDAVPFRSSPSLFYLSPTDSTFRLASWLGLAIALLMVSGYPQRWGGAAAATGWALLWVLYLSFVNVGQIFYGFGWETLLLEAGFLAIFLGGWHTTPSVIVNGLYRWLLFRVMFGAGLIKLRGDPCWRQLTCLDSYFETQPMPNALSWYFHWMPEWVHRSGVMINHVVEIGVPFAFFLPQPIASIAAAVTILFQLTLILSGNLSWLNWLTIVLCIPLLDDRWLSWLPISPPALVANGVFARGVTYALVALVAYLSVSPLRNMLSPSQMMNASFEPLHLVNTYGAFGSITKTRFEIVIEGTTDAAITDATVWRPYEFKGKPGDPFHRPPQIAPYHLRLDWLMWFEAMSPAPTDRWFYALIEKLLTGDPATVGLLGGNPFPDGPPRYIRALYYEYRFTTPDEHRKTGAWWHRDLAGEFLPPVKATG